MSLPLADQKLGSHSNQDSTSHKFMLKGRQSGGIHKSHAWVFRAESYDTMMAWFNDIKSLTETSGPAREAFIRRTHARSISGGSISEGSALDEDEADQVPYSASASQVEPSTVKLPQRPNPGGRFPSLLSVNRDSHVPLSPSSGSENSGEREIVAAAGALPGSGIPFGSSGQQVKVGDDEMLPERRELRGGTAAPWNSDPQPLVQANQNLSGLPIHPGEDSASPPVQAQGTSSDGPGFVAHAQHPMLGRHDSTYGEWMAPAAATTAGATITTAGKAPYAHNRGQKEQGQEEQPGLQPVEMSADPVSQGNISMNAPGTANISSFNISDTNQGAVGVDGNLSSQEPNPETVAADTTDSVMPVNDLAKRPLLDSHTSATSVSKLHVPGEFPKSRTNTETS